MTDLREQGMADAAARVELLKDTNPALYEACQSYASRRLPWMRDHRRDDAPVEGEADTGQLLAEYRAAHPEEFTTSRSMRQDEDPAGRDVRVAGWRETQEREDALSGDGFRWPRDGAQRE